MLQFSPWRASSASAPLDNRLALTVFFSFSLLEKKRKKGEKQQNKPPHQTIKSSTVIFMTLEPSGSFFRLHTVSFESTRCLARFVRVRWSELMRLLWPRMEQVSNGISQAQYTPYVWEKNASKEEHLFHWAADRSTVRSAGRKQPVNQPLNFETLLHCRKHRVSKLLN